MALNFRRQPESAAATILPIVGLAVLLVAVAGAWARFRLDARASQPAASPTPASATGRGLTVDVARDGKITVAGAETSVAALDDLVRREAGGSAGRLPVTVRADARARAEFVNRVLGRLRQAGVRSVRLVVLAPAGG